MKKVLALDLSTTCTGWAFFEGEELVGHDYIKPKVKNVSKMAYPKQQLRKIENICEEIIDLIDSCNPDEIVIEEVNRHKNRKAGKTLDGLHFILFSYFNDEQLDNLYFIDSDGATGWRTRLNLRLSQQDKELNKERKKLNSKIGKGQKKIPIINKKHLAQRWVNKTYLLDFDVDRSSWESDVCDAIGLGSVFIRFRKLI